MISRATVWWLGLSQLICWGITYYLIGVFGEFIERDLGWSRLVIYGGFSVALLVMGISSPITGRLIDLYGGRRVMVAGSCLTAVGCATLATANTVATYFAAWLMIGISMRLTLYDAAFAALARLGGPLAKRPISQVTLLGGLASTVFWPIGHGLASTFGWRGALLAYAAIALLTIPIHLRIPSGRYGETTGQGAERHSSEAARSERRHLVASGLYATIFACLAFMNSAMSAHMLPILIGLGLSASMAVWISSLRGIGQSTARLCEVLFGARIHPLNLNVAAIALLPICFIAATYSGVFVAAAVAFAFIYGAGNGLTTITRGTIPLFLMDYRAYGARVGRLLVPSFLMSAAAPSIYAWVIEMFGNVAALNLSIVISLVALGAACALRALVRTSAVDLTAARPVVTQ